MQKRTVPELLGDIKMRLPLIGEAIDGDRMATAHRLAEAGVGDMTELMDALADAAYPHAPDHTGPLVVQGEIPGIPRTEAR